MQKKLKILFVALALITLTFIFVGCKHTHEFNEMVATDTFLNTPATCTQKATYFYSCKCGKKGTETFETAVVDHNFINNQPCTFCNASYGLEYEVVEYENVYMVVSVGDCIDKNIVIPKLYNKLPVMSIGNYAFSDCKSLASITIPDSVTGIGYRAFYNCTSLTSVTIPDSVTSIGKYAFYNCTNLTSVTIGNRVTSIGYRAFNYCTSLVNITIPDSVTSIGDDAFSSCTSLTSVTIGNSVISIGQKAFYNCTSLVTITIPNSVTIIGYMAFNNCTSLTSVTIGNSVASIDYAAFSDCTSLKTVYYNGTAEEWAKISISNYNGPLENATRYYYRETEPTEDGNYWHYDTDGKTPIIWTKQD